MFSTIGSDTRAELIRSVYILYCALIIILYPWPCQFIGIWRSRGFAFVCLIYIYIYIYNVYTYINSLSEIEDVYRFCNDSLYINSRILLIFSNRFGSESFGRDCSGMIIF